MWKLLMQSYSLYEDYARQINIVLLALCLGGLVANMIVRRPHLMRRTRRVLGWIILIFINFVYGYSIAIREHRTFNASVLVATLLLAGLLVALLWHPDGDEKPPPYDGAVTSRFLLWLDERVRVYKAWRERNQEDE